MRDVWLVVISYVRFPHFISGVFTNETAMRGERIGAPLFTPPHTHDLLLFPLTNHLPPFIIYIANPNARLLFFVLLSSFFVSSTKKREKERKRNCLGIGFIVFLVTKLSRLVLLTPNRWIIHCLTAETKPENQLLSERNA
jgi:hypothetical protein